MKRITNGFIIACVFINTISCGTILKLFRSSGSYQVSVMQTEGTSSLAIGKIASRDARFAPYLIDNFKDMLQLQLIDEGYTLKEIPNRKNLKPSVGASGERQEPKNPLPENTEPPKQSSDDNTLNLRELLPENLRNVLDKGAVVGFSDVSKEGKEDDFLSSEEVKILSEKYNLNYFVQGAVGNNDSGTLLEEDSNSLVFLKIYDSNGTLKGGIAYTVNGRSLTEATLLRDVCKQISNKMAGIVGKK
ncbi:lipoprotein [Leptospira sp. WS92.C1]